MTHYLSNIAIELPSTEKLSEGEIGHDSQDPRYAPSSRCLVSSVIYDRLATDHLVHLFISLTMIPFLSYSLSAGP